MNTMNIVKSIAMLGFFMMSTGVFRARETTEEVAHGIFFDESKWLNYPKLEHMASSSEMQSHSSKGSCKAYQEHQKTQSTLPNDATASATMLWKLKNDELHAQCLIETIEETIIRLKEQLKKDRLRWNQVKAEYSKTSEG